jgi:hypothetical protein
MTRIIDATPKASSATSNTIEVVQANTFTAPCVLRHAAASWVKAKADSAANADIWLCTAATPTSFKVASSVETYPFPNHGLGADNAVLMLSPTVDGAIVTSVLPTGSVRVLIGIIFDKDNILWMPSLKIEVV